MSTSCSLDLGLRFEGPEAAGQLGRERVAVPPRAASDRRRRLRQVVAQALGARGVSELAERLCLDLPDALPGDAELAPHLFQRALTAVRQTEAELEHPPLTQRQ